MKTQIKWSLLTAAVVALGACNSGQPTPPCAVGHGGYSAKYTLVAGSCTGTGCEAAPSATSGSCIRSGDIIGVDKYRPTTASGSQTVWLKAEPLAEAEFGTVAGDVSPGIGSGALAAATGDAQNFCNVPTVTAMTGTTLLGDTLTYTFSNVKFYMTGAVPGTQFKADLSISGADCTARYTVDALYPVVFCPAFDANGDATGLGDVTACSAPDQWWSYVEANPMFDMECAATGNMAKDWDQATLTNTDAFGLPVPHWLCVPKNAVPSVKP